MDRNRNIILTLMVVTAISLLLAVTFAAKRKVEVQKCAALELQVNKLIYQNQALESNLKEIMVTLENEKMTNGTLKTTLAQEQLKNQSLASELEKTNQIKTALEEKLSQESRASSSAPAPAKAGKK